MTSYNDDVVVVSVVVKKKKKKGIGNTCTGLVALQHNYNCEGREKRRKTT